MTATIRHATPADVPAIQELVQPFVAERKLLPRTDDDLRVLVQNGFVAEADNQLVGFAAVEIYSRKLAEVQCLAVAKTYQSQGIGKRLVQHCVQCARDKHVVELMAISASDQFLKECGFDYALPDQKRALFIQTRDPHQT